MRKKTEELEKILDVKFKDNKLLVKSITHKSYNSNENFEKLEFLGDRVLGLVISKKLLEMYPEEKEGTLDKKLASLVNKNQCYNVGMNLELQNYLLVGNIKKSLNFSEKKIISDCVEAIIGAIFIDRGLNVVERFILNKWHSKINSSIDTQIDSKTLLQEYSLKKFKSLPIYKLISNKGPRHNPVFTVAVKLKNTNFVEGSGSSKKNAEQVAAKKVLIKLENSNDLAR